MIQSMFQYLFLHAIKQAKFILAPSICSFVLTVLRKRLTEFQFRKDSLGFL